MLLLILDVQLRIIVSVSTNDFTIYHHLFFVLVVEPFIETSPVEAVELDCVIVRTYCTDFAGSLIM